MKFVVNMLNYVQADLGLAQILFLLYYLFVLHGKLG